MIADLKLRQSEIIKDNQSQSDSESEHSVSYIIDNDICLDPITNDEIASVSEIIPNQSQSDIIQYQSFPFIEPKEPSINEISIMQLMQENNIVSKFNKQEQEAIIQAKANENLVEFAASLPPPK